MWLQSAHMQGLGSTATRAAAITTASHSTLQLCKASPPPPPECAVTQSMQNSFSRGQFDIPRLYGSALGRRRQRRRVPPVCVFPLTEDNVERVLDEVRPSLMADGGNVALHEIDGLVVVLKLQGACGSCPSSTMTLKMGIETRLRDKIPEIEAVEQILDTETGLELNEENVENIPDQSMLTVCLLYVVGGEYRRSHFGPCGDKTIPCWNRRWSARAHSDQWLHFEGSTEWTCSWGYDGSRGVDAEIER